MDHGEPGLSARPRGILFLCVANSSRSQIAEGLARAMSGDGIRIESAGSAPATVHPLALRVLAEAGVDHGSARSKHWSSVPLEGIDLIVTLCAEEVCPVVPGSIRRLHWALPDPAAATGSEDERLAAFRSVREELESRLRELLQRA